MTIFATIALKPLSDAGVDLDHLTVASGTLTGVTAIAAPADGNKSILSAPNANDSWSEEAIEGTAAAIERTPEGSILVADFEVPACVLEVAFRAAAQRGFRILVDPTFADRMEKARLDRFHAVTPNEKEAAQFLGMDIPDASAAERAACKLNALGVEIACVKLSTGGCVLAHDGRAMLVRAPAGDVVDKTGAVDAFLAALAVALLEGKSACEAACWGVAASTISVAASGAQESYPTRDELDQMIAAVLRLKGTHDVAGTPSAATETV